MDEVENEALLAIEDDDNMENNDEEVEAETNDDGIDQYEISLSSQHQYLGATEELSGRTVISENDYITIPIFMPSIAVNVVLLPNQTLPMTIFQPLLQSMLKKVIAKDKIFGIIHTQMPMAHYGTTAEIFEYHEDESAGSLSIKTKGRQRFKVMKLFRETTGCFVGTVKILPNIKMPDPLQHVRLTTHQVLNMSSSCEEVGQNLVVRKLESLRSARSWKARRRSAMLTPWPSWVYDMYDDQQLALKLSNEIVDSFQVQTNIKIPRDPEELSYWASINLPMSDSNRMDLLALDSATQRLRFILSLTTQILKQRKLSCKFCSKVIAITSDIFSMSTDGPQGTFVNPDGYVHEMITVTKATGLRPNGETSTRHSWFPGYSWQIVSCRNCHSHIGWCFRAEKLRMKPSMFYGLTRKAVSTSQQNDSSPLFYVI